MAATKIIPSFDDIIQADRQRRKNEALANEIFGKGRRATTPVQGGKRKPGTGPSLASRVGITKASQRSASSASKARSKLDKNWSHDQSQSSPAHPTRLSRAGHEPNYPRVARKTAQLFNAPGGTKPQSSVGSQPAAQPSDIGMTIRGLAGPYTVVASNFAPGTTSADISSAMIPLGGEMQSCRVVTASPTVIAEMVFTDKGGAENVIATFNNQKADGRLLHLYMKHGPPTPLVASPPVAAPAARPAPTEPRAEHLNSTRMEISADKSFGERNSRRAEPEFQDGRYGFDEGDEGMDVDMDERRPPRRETVTGEREDSERGRHVGRGRDDRWLYSDRFFPQSRGRGFR